MNGDSPKNDDDNYNSNSNNNGDDDDDDEDDDDDDNDIAMDENDIRARTKHLSPKERRQLRNKISARNFRIRRKEYIGELEEKISQQDCVVRDLREENRRLNEVNMELFQELQQWRQGTMNIPSLASPPSSSSSDSHSPVQAGTNMADPGNILHIDFDDLYDFGPFNNILTNSTYLSYTVIPDFDFFRNMSGKGSRLNICDANETGDNDDVELIRTYPLLAPALMSIVMHHTFTLNYAAYLADSFPYTQCTNTSDPFNPKSMVTSHKSGGVLSPEEWFSAMVALQEGQSITENNAKDDDGDCFDDETTCCDYDDERCQDYLSKGVQALEAKAYVLNKWHSHYVMWKMCGYSQEKIMEKFAACVEKQEEDERRKQEAKKDKAQKKATKRPSAVVTSARSVIAFCSIASTLLRNPNSTHQIGRIVNQNKHINPKPCSKKGITFSSNSAGCSTTTKVFRPFGITITK
ncbi:hypothetical protein J3Q64DRAFT_1753728 [Phycomyces blakesleeanus]